MDKPLRKSSFDLQGLLACARGELFGPGNAQLPLPPMLMFDRITTITEDGGDDGKGQIVAEFDIHPDLWFFKCHFQGDPVMPGCLGLDALWQMVGFFLGWMGGVGRGRALGVDEVKFTGMVLPTAKKITYIVNLKRVIMRKLVLGIADGIMKVDGKVIYEAKDLKVGLFTDAAASHWPRNQRQLDARPSRLIAWAKSEGSALMQNEWSLPASASCPPSATMPQEVAVQLHACPFGHRRGARIISASASARQVHGKPEDQSRRDGGSPGPPFPGRRRGLLLGGDEPGHRRCRPGGKDLVSNPRTGLIVGSGGPSTKAIVQAADITRQNNCAQAHRASSRCPRRCRPPSAPIFRPGSRPRATIIPSLAPVRPRPTASAMPSS